MQVHMEAIYSHQAAYLHLLLAQNTDTNIAIDNSRLSLSLSLFGPTPLSFCPRRLLLPVTAYAMSETDRIHWGA